MARRSIARMWSADSITQARAGIFSPKAQTRLSDPHLSAATNSQSLYRSLSVGRPVSLEAYNYPALACVVVVPRESLIAELKWVGTGPTPRACAVRRLR